jgi:peptidoglycan/LPS O-acetylase OafA/YrhL
MPTPSPSLAVHNLRTFAVMVVLAVHSSAAYLGSSPATSFRFDDPPFGWRALPIIDSDRWFGFDIFCAHEDTYLITLLFFLSGLFVWPSLVRKGAGRFLRERVIRIGIPFTLAVGVMMPVALYPVYRLTAVDPGLTAYWHHWLALPLWPSGPPWFLWVLLVFDVTAAALYRFARRSGEALGRAAGWLGARPAAFVTVLLSASALAYIPLALAFTPWAWFQAGPFGFQECRPLLYAFWFFAGVGLGAHGLERGPLAPGGWLAQRWRTAGWAALAAFAIWLASAGLASMASPSRIVRILEAVSYVPCCAAGCLFMLALFVRFANRHVRIFDALGDKAYGLYLVHYLFAVWLQFLLLGLVLPGLAAVAILKATVVFCGTMALSFAMVAVIQRALTVLPDERKRTPWGGVGVVIPPDDVSGVMLSHDGKSQ